MVRHFKTTKPIRIFNDNNTFLVLDRKIRMFLLFILFLHLQHDSERTDLNTAMENVLK